MNFSSYSYWVCQECHALTMLFPWTIFFFFFFCLFRAAPVAYGSFQARGLNGSCSRQLLPVTATWHLSCVYKLHHRLWQLQILNLLSEARDGTHVLTDTSWVITAEPQWELSTFFNALITLLYIQNFLIVILSFMFVIFTLSYINFYIIEYEKFGIKMANVKRI